MMLPALSTLLAFAVCRVTGSFTPVRMEADLIASRVPLDAPPIALSCMTAFVRYAISPSA
jgi:hypothetical protein